jgi:hypothetical protein
MAKKDKSTNHFGKLNTDSQMPMENLPMSKRIEKGSNGVPRSPMNGTPKKFDLTNGKDCLGETPKKGKK